MKAWLKTLVSLVLLVLVLKQIPLAQTWQVLIQTQAGLASLGLILLIFFSICNSIRLFLVIKYLVKNSKPQFAQVLRAYFIGYFYNLFLPSSVGGDIAKGAALASQNVSKKIGVSASFIDRIAGLGGLAIVGLVGSGLTQFKQLNLPFSIFIPLSVFSLIIIGVGIFIVFAEKIVSLSQHFKLLKFMAFLNQLDLEQKTTLINLVLISSFLQIFSVTIASVSARAVGISLDPIYFAIYVPFISLILLLPITIAGIGLREASAVSLYSSLGIAEESTLAFTSLNFGYIVITGIIGGLWQAIPQKVVSKKLKKLLK